MQEQNSTSLIAWFILALFSLAFVNLNFLLWVLLDDTRLLWGAGWSILFCFLSVGNLAAVSGERKSTQ